MVFPIEQEWIRVNSLLEYKGEWEKKEVEGNEGYTFSGEFRHESGEIDMFLNTSVRAYISIKPSFVMPFPKKLKKKLGVKGVPRKRKSNGYLGMEYYGMDTNVQIIAHFKDGRTYTWHRNNHSTRNIYRRSFSFS